MKRYLTKSRYKLGLECPTKLYYTNKKKEYADVKLDDPFLMALANGGFQVEALARLEYFSGVLIEANGGDYQNAIDQTNQLLKLEQCVIFEAAFLYDNLFIRTDILVKNGNQIHLIEVKAKSADSLDENIFEGKRGGIVGSWKPYLFDVAFQRYVIQKSFPEFTVKASLKLADKSKIAKVDGLNQLFRISKNGDKRKDTLQLVKHISEIGESVLSDFSVDDVLDRIVSNTHNYSEDFVYGFEEGIQFLSENYKNDTKVSFPMVFGTCKKCEFKHNPTKPELKSGFEVCLMEKMGLTKDELKKPSSMEIWRFIKGKNLLRDHGIYFMSDITESLHPIEVGNGKLSNSERQWLQIEKTVEMDNSIHVLKDELKEVMNKWQFPFHFIDFETSTVALPFYKGRKPYEQVAFQFSHHIVTEDGTITHANQFILDEAGKFPNFEFVRALKNALGDAGTIFRYSNHENSILNAIYFQLLQSSEADKQELMEFIKTITNSKKESVEQWQGARSMVDLCEIYKNYYFDPMTKGSNSIKAVLPALLKRSQLLQTKYAKTIGELGISSLNFSGTQCWLKVIDGEVQNPYKQLPPLFHEWSEEQLDTLVSDIEDVNNGGAALSAYGFLQYTDMNAEERKEMVTALLRYCELDTLAMVMLWEHFMEII